MLLLAAVAVVYAPALGGGYMFDDRYIVLDAPMVEELRPVGEYFTRPFFTNSAGAALTHSYYRPLVILSLAIDYTLHAGNAPLDPCARHAMAGTSGRILLRIHGLCLSELDWAARGAELEVRAIRARIDAVPRESKERCRHLCDRRRAAGLDPANVLREG